MIILHLFQRVDHGLGTTCMGFTFGMCCHLLLMQAESSYKASAGLQIIGFSLQLSDIFIYGANFSRILCIRYGLSKLNFSHEFRLANNLLPKLIYHTSSKVVIVIANRC